MNILVTGGAGFIGSHIQDRLIELGHDVTIIDDFSTGKREYVNAQAKVVEGTIKDRKLVSAIFDDGKFDLVVHHAAQINVRKSFEDPVYDCRVNVLGTLNILKRMIEHNTPKIIFASTGGAIYGSPASLPVSETHPTNPESPYAISKQACENYIKNLSGLYGYKYTILRYANVYGPRQIAKGEAGVVAIFTERILDGKNPVIFGSGDHTRDYVYVHDVVAANIAAMDKADNEIINIGTGVETDVHEVYRAIANAFGDRALEAQNAPEVPEVARIALDCSKAKSVLGWTPSMSFDDGVKLTVKSFGVNV